MFRNKILRFKKIYKLALCYIFIRVISFHLFIKNVFTKIKNSIFTLKYKRYGKNVKKTKFFISKRSTNFILMQMWLQWVLSKNRARSASMTIRMCSLRPIYRRTLGKLNFSSHLKSKTNLAICMQRT